MRQNLPAVQFVTIDKTSAGQRLDNFLFKTLKKVPKSLLYKVIRQGNVRINKKRCKPETRLILGDEVRIPPFHQAESVQLKPSEHFLAQLKASVIYEDAHLLAINKPAGMAVHAGSSVDYGVAEGLSLLYSGLQLVHRLDKETSGVLLLAKDRETLVSIQDLFRSGQMQKQYLALTQGRWVKRVTAVDFPLEKIKLAGEHWVQESVRGKQALTTFRVKQVFKAGTLMEVDLGTGRTHQIRVHAQLSGHPVAGDEKYGDKVFNKSMRSFGLSRMFLHAEQLAFTLPSTKQEIRLVAPLPLALQQVVERLEHSV